MIPSCFIVVHLCLPAQSLFMAKVAATTEAEDVVAMQQVELLATEGSPMGFMYVPGVNTLSFFSGDLEEAVTYYTQRLRLILQANPWLSGTLISKKEGKVEKVYLQYRQNPPSDEEAAKEISGSPESKVTPLLVIDREGKMKVSSKNSYQANLNALNGAKCLQPDGYTAMAAKSPLSTFTLTTCEGGFALVSSISHVVSDGATYYGIIGMLSENAKIDSFVTERKHVFSEEHDKLVGKVQSEFLFGMNMYNMGMMYQAIGGMCCCKKKMHVSYYIDANKVTALKEKVKGEGEVPFCSTTDLITSHFCNVSQPRVLQYAINLRPRLSALLTDKHAGNYESCLLFGPDIYSKPANVRKAVSNTPFSHSGSEGKAPLVRGCTALRAKSSMLTSWCFDTYSGDLSFGSCKLTLHIPMMDTTGMPVCLGVIYKAAPGKLGVLYFVDPKMVSKLHTNTDTPLSTDEIFPGC